MEKNNIIKKAIFLLIVLGIGFAGGRFYQHHLFEETLKEQIALQKKLLENRTDKSAIAQKILLEQIK